MRALRDEDETVLGRRQATLFVCLTCRVAGATADDPEATRAGAGLYKALVAARGDDARLRVQGVECLSNCNRACTVALSGGGRWSYVYGDLDPKSCIDDLLAGAELYALSEDGIVPWRERPAILRRGVIARIPPLVR